VARLEHLGLPQRTISMLEESKFSIITLRDLVNVRRTDLQQIRHLGEGAIDRILDCLTRYDQLESQPPQN
jgi:hypothetical protein